MTKMITEGNNKHNISGDPIREVSLQFTRNDKHRNFNKRVVRVEGIRIVMMRT